MFSLFVDQVGQVDESFDDVRGLATKLIVVEK
jgi:hypothetical protein